KGENGEKGQQGIAGPAGPQGPQGPEGPAGADGILTGQAGGDLSGTYPDPVVTKLQGVPIADAAPANNDILRFDGSQWTPAALANNGFQLPVSATENLPSTLFSITNEGNGTAGNL